jgi:AraC-like DNA-binding protein
MLSPMPTRSEACVSDILENAQLLIGFNGLILSAVLVGLKLNGRPVNMVVPAIFTTFAIHMIGNFNFEANGPRWLSELRFSLGYIYGPLFYLYTREFLAPLPRWNKNDLIHFLPALIGYPLLGVLGVSAFGAGMTIMLSLGCYLLIAARELHAQPPGSLEAGRRSWAGGMLAVGGIILALNIATLTLAGRIPVEIYDIIELALFGFLLLLVCAFIVAGLSQPEILMQNFRTKVLGSQDVSEQEAARIVGRLVRAVEDGQLALDEVVSLNELARIVGEPSRQVSLAIKQVTDLGVPDWINSQRVEAVIGLMAVPQNRDVALLDLAYEAGFNSKATFNRAFRRHTGMSPSRYRVEQGSIASKV